MKFSYTLLGLFLLLLVSCNRADFQSLSPDPFLGFQKNLDDFNIKGSVKSVQEASYTILTSANETIDWDEHLSDEKSNFLRFDKNRRMIEKFDRDEKNYILYNNEGQLIKVEYYKDQEDKNNNRKKINLDFKYNYDDRLGRIERSDDYTHSFDYDDNGNCIKFSTFGDGNNDYRNFEYDNQRRVIKHNDKEYVYKNNTIIDTTYENGEADILNIRKYNGDKILLKERYDIRYGKPTIKSRVYYKYNYYGHLIDKLETEGEHDTRKNHYVNEYEYDTESNWIKKVEFLNGQLERAKIRKIEYYQRKYFGILK